MRTHRDMLGGGEKAAHVPFYELSMTVGRFRERTMAAFKGYFDDSGKDDDAHCVVIAGFVGDNAAWEIFEEKWLAVLRALEIPYMHMKEISDPKSPLHKFCGSENEVARNFLFANLIGAILRAKLWAFGALVRLPDLRQFNLERGRDVRAVPLALYGCMKEIALKEFPELVEGVIDRIDKPEKQIATAVEYAETDPYKIVSDNVTMLPLKGNLSFKNVLPIQAADFLAWEIRKNHLQLSEWWNTEDRGKDDPVKAAMSQIQWMNKQGKTWPNQRASYTLLGHAAHPHGGVWDLDYLRRLDDERKGNWSSE